MISTKLLPCPRWLKVGRGTYRLPKKGVVYFAPTLDRDRVVLPLAKRLKAAAAGTGTELECITGPQDHPELIIRLAAPDITGPVAKAWWAGAGSGFLPKGATKGVSWRNHLEGYRLTIGPKGVEVFYGEEGGLRAAVATLRQMIREHGRELPYVEIEDYPDFGRRGVMLDVSRGRVPKLETLLGLAEHLADFKINELQLYTEHTFAYRNYEPVWRGWGPLTGEEILVLDARCRELGIDLVPNQNSFGHLRYWLEYGPLRPLAEVAEPYESPDGTFLRYPTTLAPNHRGTLPFLRELFEELLPHFSSSYFNVGCDETWDLGRGQSKADCERRGQGRVYLDFLKRIEREVSKHGRQTMLWGDIILKYPELIPDLPKNVIALNWGYEADHPFAREASLFAKSKVPFYVCPGTSTWMSLIGRHDNALGNLRTAAEAGLRYGARGFLNTDWGDGGHPQPLAVSYLPYLAGAALSWCGASFDEELLGPVLSRDVFEDPTGQAARGALRLGNAHRKFEYLAPNVTPFGAVIAAPPPAWRELVCRDGLKYYARISGKRIAAALHEVEAGLRVVSKARPVSVSGQLLVKELELAGRMAAESCRIMEWQQAVVGGGKARARRLAKAAVKRLREMDGEYTALWKVRNKGTPAKSSGFFQWRIREMLKAKTD